MWLGLLGQHIVEHSRYINVNCQHIQTHIASYLEGFSELIASYFLPDFHLTLQFPTNWLLMLYLLMIDNRYFIYEQQFPLNLSAVQTLLLLV